MLFWQVYYLYLQRAYVVRIVIICSWLYSGYLWCFDRGVKILWWAGIHEVFVYRDFCFCPAQYSHLPYALVYTCQLLLHSVLLYLLHVLPPALSLPRQGSHNNGGCQQKLLARRLYHSSPRDRILFYLNFISLALLRRITRCIPPPSSLVLFQPPSSRCRRTARIPTASSQKATSRILVVSRHTRQLLRRPWSHPTLRVSIQSAQSLPSLLRLL